MGFLTVQNDFTHGEFSPRLVARSDITLYKKAASKLRNVLVIPEGGVIRRFGTTTIDKLGNQGSPIAENEYRLGQFQFDEQTNYLLIFTDALLRIYINDLLLVTVVSPYDGTEVQSIKFAQTTNSLVITHPDFQPRELFRDATDQTIWTLQAITFTFLPVHDFFQGTYDAQTFTLSLATVGTGRTLTITAGTFVLTDAFIGGAFVAGGANVDEPIGYARITAVASAVSATVDIVIAFGATAAAGTDVAIAEKAWSDLEADSSGDRGWPVSVTFYQDRLYFGGSRSLPQTLFGSQVGDFIDFEVATGEDDEAIITQLSSNTINDIKHIVSDRSLQIFTFSSEWTPPQLENDPLTPTNISVRKQTNKGTTDVEPVSLDNVTFYVKRGGKGVIAYQFSNDNQAYNSEDISILSSDLIRNPVDSAVLSNSTREDADYLFLCNEDGTLAAYQTLQAQDVSAWTLQETFDRKGESEILANFKRVVSVGDNIYFLINRPNVDNTFGPFLEKLNFDVFTDATISQTFGSPVKVISGLDDLEGQTVQVRGDDFVFPDKVVTSGQIDLTDDIAPDSDGVSSADVGLGFNTEVSSLPIVIATSSGETNYVPKRVNRVFINFFESLGVSVNGIPIPNLEFNDTFTIDCLQESCPPQTGVEQVYIQGWEISPTVSITQDKPLPMTILAVGFEVGT